MQIGETEKKILNFLAINNFGKEETIRRSIKRKSPLYAEIKRLRYKRLIQISEVVKGKRVYKLTNSGMIQLAKNKKLLYKKKLTPKRQGKRKTEGNMAENIIRDEMKNIMPDNYNFRINRNNGVDLYIKNGQILNVEVKSAKEKTLYKYKDQHKRRTGRFLIKESDYLESDFFAFVIKNVDEKCKWDGTTTTKYVDSNQISKYLKERNLYRKGKNIKIGINTIIKMKDYDLKQFK